MTPPVLITGAGPTGLVLAYSLARQNIPVRLIDKTDQPGTTSRALGVQARTLEFYHQFGFADQVIHAGVQTPAVNLWVNGSPAARLPIRNLGQSLTPYPYVLMYPQDEHEQLLIDHLATLNVHVERRTELLRFTQHPTHITATLQRPDGTEETLDTPYLAGCDGARSTVRTSLHTGFPGGTYDQLFYVADVTATGPPANGEIHLELQQSDFLALFPLKGTGRMRLIGALRPPEGKRDLTFADVSPRAIENLNLKITHVNWFSTYRVHHRVASRFRDRRAFLLGDAAHIHSPAGAQGMNTGIGDSINLAWKLAAVLHGTLPDTLLDTYELERIPFARRLVNTTDRVFTFVTRSGPLAKLLRTRVAPIVIPLLFRPPPVRRFLFRTVSQIGIRYRHSPLSQGRAGPLHAGDRLPWLSNPDNFAPLSSLAWQVHLYGHPSPTLQNLCADLHLPLHTFPWHPDMKRAHLRQDTIYLIRPDGYIAFASPQTNTDALRTYWSTLHRPAVDIE